MLMTRVLAWTAATITIATMTVGAQPARRPAQSSLRSERAFATELQRALRTGDRQAVTRLVRYPARVSVLQRPHPIYIKDRDALEQMYDIVFTPHLRCAVVDSREPVVGKPQPKYALLLARGVVSLAGGRVIAEGAQGKYQITRLTSFGDTSTRLGKPRPVTFAGGQQTVELGGRVAELGARRLHRGRERGRPPSHGHQRLPDGEPLVARLATRQRHVSRWRQQRRQRMGSAAH